jgi:hypothetical protein
MGIRNKLVAGTIVAAASGSAFAQAASEPYTEPTQITSQAVTQSPVCTVRLNRFHADDKAPVNVRYIGTQYENELTRNGPHAKQLFPSSSLSGITYVQKGDIANQDNIFWAEPTLGPTKIDIMFVPERTLDNMLMDNGKYRDRSTNGSIGIFAPAHTMNWSESFEIDIHIPRTCLLARKSIVSWPPEYGISLFSNVLGNTDSDGYANSVWKLLGDATKDAKHISRAERLKEHGEPKADNATLPPPFRPQP